MTSYDLEPLALTPRQAAAKLGVGVDTIYALVAANRIPCIRLGERLIRIPVGLLEAWIVEQAAS